MMVAGDALASPFAAEFGLNVVAYRVAPATTGWYAKGAWTSQYRLYAAGCWTWCDWWRPATLGRATDAA